MEKEQRDDCLRQLKENGLISVRQISRITGITFNIVAKA
jgi:hypothetical protein